MFGCFAGWGAGGWSLVGGIIGLLVFIGLIVALAVVGVLLVQKSRQTTETYPHAEAADEAHADALKVRYARGGLPREEYLRLQERDGRRGER